MTMPKKVWNSVYYKNFSRLAVLLKKLVPFLKFDSLSTLFPNYVLLVKESNPTVLFYGTGSFKFPDLTNKQQEFLKERVVHFYMYEPLVLYSPEEVSRGFYNEFSSSASLNLIKSRELDSIEDIANRYQIIPTVYTCDYNIDFLRVQYPALRLFTLDVYLRSGLSKKENLIIEHRSFTKSFWCGNLRYTLARHLITAYLIKYLGNYSWHFECNLELVENSTVFDFNTLKENNIKLYNDLCNGVAFLEKNILNIDLNLSNSIKITKPNDYAVANNSEKSMKFYNSMLDSFCCVVNETRFFQPTSNVSEKTLMPFKVKRPIILVAPPNSLEYIKKLGFKTFSDFWDESYDTEEDHTLRMIKIFKLIDYLGSLSNAEQQQMYDKMMPILVHNQKLAWAMDKNKVLL